MLTRNESPGVRTPITMRISADDAKTWGAPLSIASVVTPDERGVRRQVSYPSVTQLRDGTLVVLWADIGVSDAAQWGDIVCARVRLTTR